MTTKIIQTIDNHLAEAIFGNRASLTRACVESCGKVTGSLPVGPRSMNVKKIGYTINKGQCCATKNMFVMTNYTKNYASKIYQNLLEY